MKTVSITLEVPEWVNKFFKREAKRQLISKSALIRKKLAEHVEKEAPELVSQNGGSK